MMPNEQRQRQFDRERRRRNAVARRRRHRQFLAAWAGIVGLNLMFWGAMIFVAIHFITKWW